MSSPADAGAGPYRRILVIVVALILYGSLYPWQFQARHYDHNPLWILFHRWPDHFDRYTAWDIVINIALYVPLGIFGYLAVNAKASRAARILFPFTLAVVISAGVEMLQLFDDSRMCSLSDLVSNATGAGVGIAAGALYSGALRHLLARQGPASLLRPSGAVMLLSCWLGYQVFPIFPSWGRTSLFRRMAAVGPLASLSPVDTLLVFAEWLAVACLLESILKRHTGRLLAVMLMLVPARLIIASRTLTWADIVGAGAAYAVWMLLPRLYVRRAAPVLLTGAVVLAELSPFHFAAPHAFNWVPFRGLFRSDWQDGFVVLFRKSFWYGSILWMWRAAGHRLVLRAGIAAAVLFALERAQIYLPGRTSEITDSVLAVLMAVLLWLLRDV